MINDNKTEINWLPIACIKANLENITVYTFSADIKDILKICYVAVRGKDNEEGAVQRTLSTNRIDSIKEFVMKGNEFFNTFILNWTNNDFKPDVSNDGFIKIPFLPSSAQIIDGQHRLAGLNEAIKINDAIGNKKILISMCLGLSTKEAANIFININSQQRPVPKSLIYDLFGEIIDNQDHEIIRANDIAHELHKNVESPYYNSIKFPGSPRGVGMVDLSAIIGVLKKHLEPTGALVLHRINNLNNQKNLILNFFKAIKKFYDQKDLWFNKNKNPFLTNAGFIGAIEYLITNLLTKCAEKKSFKVTDFINLLNLDINNLLLKSDIKNLGGEKQRKTVYEYLKDNQLRTLSNEENYEF